MQSMRGRDIPLKHGKSNNKKLIIIINVNVFQMIKVTTLMPSRTTLLLLYLTLIFLSFYLFETKEGSSTPALISVVPSSSLFYTRPQFQLLQKFDFVSMSTLAQLGAERKLIFSSSGFLKVCRLSVGEEIPCNRRFCVLESTKLCQFMRPHPPPPPSSPRKLYNCHFMRVQIVQLVDIEYDKRLQD